MQKKIVDSRWVGEWVRDAAGKPVPFVCLYILTAGALNFCGDCTHAMSEKSVPMVEWPDHAADETSDMSAPQPKPWTWIDTVIVGVGDHRRRGDPGDRAGGFDARMTRIRARRLRTFRMPL